MYVCGVTVYDYCHIGHARSALVFDVIRRYLEFSGYQVDFVKNFTDVDDKIIKRANEQGVSCDTITAKYIQAYYEDMGRLGIRQASIEPKATEHMADIIRLTETLVNKGLAYQVDGDVYFEVAKYSEYGRLSKRRLDDMQAGARVDVDERKRHPMDFALWKSSKPGDPSWGSPWGAGRPGWHIECSAMSMKHLGERFDVHTGGNDNKFPHHEDEIAQSEGAVGHEVVSIWVHGGFLQMSGHKMSKSAKNIYRVTDLAAHGIDPLAYRFLCFGTRYRSEMEFSWDALEGQQSRLNTLRQRMAAWAKDGAGTAVDGAAAGFDRRFRDAIADDLDLPAALVVMNEAVSSSGLTSAERVELLTSWDAVLGLDLNRFAREGPEVPEDVAELVRLRDESRAARDYQASDHLRERLTVLGWEVMDTPEGTKVRRRA
jgi:cysteinyl-tRNA synthetase